MNDIVDPMDPDYCHTCGGECVAACGTVAPQTTLARAIAYHTTVEGEYGCPGATCPGVQRLVTLLDAATAPLIDLLHDHETAWSGEEDSVQAEHAALITRTRFALGLTEED